jgi:hypothetical protein
VALVNEVLVRTRSTVEKMIFMVKFCGEDGSEKSAKLEWILLITGLR